MPPTSRRARTLAVPDPGLALSEDGPPGRPRRAGTDAACRVLRGAAWTSIVAASAVLTVPLARTVELDGRLVPERVTTVRVSEPGLLEELAVAPGDTVAPGQLVARLRSPALDEALRTSPRFDAALLARRERLDVYAPPFVSRRPDGSADPATLFHAGVVLTEDLHERYGAHLDAGDALFDLAVLGSERRLPFVVHAVADEREAQRTRTGMHARLTVTALPPDQPRQIAGTVRRVALTPGPGQADPSWRVEIIVHSAEVSTLLRCVPPDTPLLLRAGFSVRVSIQERRETLAATALRWIRTRRREAYPASPSRSASTASYRKPFSVARTVTDASGPPCS